MAGVRGPDAAMVFDEAGLGDAFKLAGFECARSENSSSEQV